MDNEESAPSFSDVVKDIEGNTDYEESYSKDDTWAIYWYLCGSDLESNGGVATIDLHEWRD
ncbi:hypothetical protein [Wukongibacter sp. M2B1]|uniref:hypothetical protein n=1 Tax=Wukongibacter sp. M2B1 TaxID=3088895 RepID=UPI003D7B4857